MIIRLLLACACVAGAFRPNALPLRAPVVSHSRIRAPAPVAFTLFEEFKERMTQMTDLRVARASHILLRRRPADEEGGESSTELLERWKQEIGDDPEEFARVARERSDCQSRSRGGDLGYFTRGKMVMEFDRIVFREEPGSVYGPVRTNFGDHLIFIHSCRNSE